jgi:putative transposase
MMEYQKRKTPIHGIQSVPGQQAIIFDTICTKDRQPWLACAIVHEQLREVWLQADAWKVGRYVIMPDHIHLFAAETKASVPYENWQRYWKSQFTKLHGVNDHRWQSHHWDVRLRTEDQMEEKWTYLLDNPVRKGLVETAAEWPYQGYYLSLLVGLIYRCGSAGASPSHIKVSGFTSKPCYAELSACCTLGKNK